MTRDLEIEMDKKDWLRRASAEFHRLGYPLEKAEAEAGEAWIISSDDDRDEARGLSRSPENVAREIDWHYRTAAAPDR